MMHVLETHKPYVADNGRCNYIAIIYYDDETDRVYKIIRRVHTINEDLNG